MKKQTLKEWQQGLHPSRFEKKRQRHVFNSIEVAHPWVHGLLEEGKSKDGRIFFRGDTIYSYGTHFVIARKVVIRNEKIILFSQRTYSHTTSKHQSEVHYAIPKDFRRVAVHDAASCPRENIKHEIWEAQQHIAKLRKAIDKPSQVDAAEACLTHALFLLDLFSRQVKNKKYFLADIAAVRREYPSNMKELRAKEDERRIRVKAANEKRREAERKKWEAYAEKCRIANERRAAERAERTERWLAGKTVRGEIERSTKDGFTLIRKKGKTVETSLGIRLPFAVFMRYYEELTGGSLKVGSHVLNFEVREMTDELIRIGCHVLRFTDIKALAA